MTAFTDAAENDIIMHMFRTGTWGKPTDVTIELYTAAPGETGGGTVVSGGSYAAVDRPPLDANWAAPSGGNGLTSNVAAIAFPAPTANWGSIQAVGIKQATVLRAYGNLTTPKTVNNGDPAPQFAAGALTFAVA